MTYNNKYVQKKQDPYVWIVFFIVCFFMVTLSISLVRLTTQYYTQKQYLRKSQQTLLALQKEQDKLRAEARYTTTDDYVEEEARRRALGKPGEQVLIGTFPTPTPIPPPVRDTTPIYAQWVAVYLQQ